MRVMTFWCNFFLSIECYALRNDRGCERSIDTWADRERRRRSFLRKCVHICLDGILEPEGEKSGKRAGE